MLPTTTEKGGQCIMKEYKIEEVKKSQAQQVMNDMAKEGWEVVSMTYWNFWKISLLITFSREIPG
jgi:hypothetical protein